MAATQAASLAIPDQTFVERLVPTNLVAAFASGDLIQVSVISALFAAGTLAAGESGGRWVSWVRDMRDVCLSVTSLLARLAPVIAFSALSAAIPTMGGDLLFAFGRLLAAAALGLFAIATLLLLGPILFLRARPGRWIAAAAPGLSIAFSAGSSAAAMPALVTGLTGIGATPERVGLVFGTSSLNQLGSAFYVALAAVTVIQAAGVALRPNDWLGLLVLVYVTTKVGPPVPRASLVLIAAVASGFGIPAPVAAPLIGLLITADVVFDMARTLVNNIGHVSVCMVLDSIVKPKEPETRASIL